MRTFRGVLALIVCLSLATLLAPAATRAALSSAPYNALLSIEGQDARQVTLSTHSIDFGSMDYGRNGPAQTVRVTAVGGQPVTFTATTLGGSTPGAFSVTTDTCANRIIASGQSCEIAITPHPTAIATQSATLGLHNNSLTPTENVGLTATGGLGNVGTYYPLAPRRILDTRSSASPLGPAGVVNHRVIGSGVPLVGVSAVVLNVTVTEPTTAGHLTVYPSGVARPNASSVNFTPGWTGANSVTVAVGTDGRVSFYNSAGRTHLVVDIVGYYAAGNEFIANQGRGGEFQPTVPERLFDSREDWRETLCGNCYVTVPVSYGSAQNPHVKALAVNITAVYPRAAGYLTAWNGNAQSSIPLASTLNYRGGQIVSNMAIVPVCLGCWTGNDFPTIGVFSSQETHVIVDIVGFYDDGQSGDGLRLNPITPTRVTDTRFGLGLPGALFQATTGKITPSTGVLPTGTQALALNVTAVQPSGNTFITVWPQGIDGIGQPMVSNLNPSAGAVVPNAAYTLLGPTSAFNVYNNAGSTHLVVDVVGTFYRYPAVPSALSRNPGPGRELRLAPTAPPATRHPAG